MTMFRRKPRRTQNRTITPPTTYRVAFAGTGATVCEFTNRRSALRYADYIGRTFLIPCYVQASR